MIGRPATGTSGFGWRSVFLINVPVGVATGILSLRAVTAGATAAGRERGRGRNLDLPGGLLVVAGLGVLVFALAGTGTHGWGSARTIVLLILAAGLLAAFGVAERLAPRSTGAFAYRPASARWQYPQPR